MKVETGDLELGGAIAFADLSFETVDLALHRAEPAIGHRLVEAFSQFDNFFGSALFHYFNSRTISGRISPDLPCRK